MNEKYICRIPGQKSRAIISRDSQVVSPSLTREYSFVFRKANGMHVWDVDGRKYLDFSASVAVMNAGHSNPWVQRAVRQQLGKALHCGFSDFFAELPVQFCEELLSHIRFPRFEKVFLSNSGTESVEAAYKLARWHSQKKWCVAFKPSFHGRTMGSLSLTNSLPVQRERFAPFLPVEHVPYPYPFRWPNGRENCVEEALEKVEQAFRKHEGDVAAVFFEPVCGEGGYIVPPKEFVKGLRKLCDRYDVLLCADEVQSGCYRTGTFWALENFRVRPDIVCMSKAIGGGIPLGATIASAKIMDWIAGSHANTFGGNLLACAAGSATLRFLKAKRLGRNAQRVGKILLKRLKELEALSSVGEVRGIGLMIGVEVEEKGRPAPELRNAVLCKAAEKGLLLLPCGASTIRICPPLIVSKTQALNAAEVLEESIRVLDRRA